MQAADRSRVAAVTPPLPHTRAPVRTPAPFYQGGPLGNPFAYIPPQCYAQTRDASGRVKNPCYVCHTRGRAPNFVDDRELQTTRKFPAGAAINPWGNSQAPAITRAAAVSDSDMLAYVRKSNYFAADGGITLARKLDDLPDAWDGDGDAHWDGYRPDAYFDFDSHGYDRRPDHTPSGWRAVAYRPLPGAFVPSNGSFTDVLMRLDPALCERADGTRDAEITALNFAIVEALISGRDVPIEPSDERAVGVDLDRDGRLGVATHIAFQADATHTSMRYVGRADVLARRGQFPIAPGLFPINTEFLHSLRYIDVRAGRVAMSARMKELRYGKKVRFVDPDDLRAQVAREVIEAEEAPGAGRRVYWQFDRGVYNGQGWLLQGFIEDRSGELRPESYEESLFCAGCHSGIGATTDSNFAFARKLTSPAQGYFHSTQSALPDQRDATGEYEYARYLRLNRSGAVIPSPARALALDRAYLAVVNEQSFARGRDALLASAPHALARVELDSATGLSVIAADTLAETAK